jgi:hypothetical protein
MASVARYLNLSVPSVSPHPPCKNISGDKKLNEPKMHLEASKKVIDTQKSRINQVVMRDNDTKDIGEVGYKFRKQFGTMGWFTGTVIEIIPKSYLRRCVYTEDGEFEDLRVADLIQLAKLDKKSQNDCSVKVSQSPPATNHRASSSAKKKQCTMRSSKYSGISGEKVAMATLASYLEECGGVFQKKSLLLSRFIMHEFQQLEHLIPYFC